MYSLFNYRTPAKFADAFKAFYANVNVKQIKILSSIIMAVTIITRIVGIIYYDKAIEIKGYQSYSLGNWVQMSGALIFFLLSSIALKSQNWNTKSKTNLTLFFILFVLLTSLSVSYVVSAYNTKNTLTMFLIGIVTVSLFFAIEFKEIAIATIVITAVFILSMVFPKVSFEDKLLNAAAAIILGFILISFSRYNYYFKSQHFIRVKELEQKNLEIEKLNTQKGEILGFVAHDLRNPLNNIEAISNLLLMDNQHSAEIEMIASSTKQAKEIINDLIEGVKLDQGVLKTEKIQLNDYLISIVQKWVSNTKKEISYTNPSKLISVHISSSKIERVIDNLISNGIKFSQPDQPITITLSVAENNACINIIDYGIGIPKALQNHIFDQFSQAGRQGLQGEKSIGLGLHISKKIIEQHEGELLMTSEENKGTTFTILLPLA